MSVELQKLRQELLREALKMGWTRPSDVPAPWTTAVPPGRIERWYQRLYTAPTGPTPVGQRLANHFTLGADPEFVFCKSDGLVVQARVSGLKAGPAWGADNNSRLVELRPHPSRSALSVLTSLWLAMRWMAIYHPDTLHYNWRGGAYYAGDGLGGHMHYGRKLALLRRDEVGALDRLTHLMFLAGIFDASEGRLRVRQAQGAPQGQPYGALGDVRWQPHGWEYRTLPSWVDDPWLAYFNLTVGKLVVAFPHLVRALSEADAGLEAEQARQQLRMLLAYFSPLDDDSRLAYAILSHRGLPQHAQGLDFKSNWGIFANGPLSSAKSIEKPSLQPTSVPPTVEDEQEMALAMFEGRPPDQTPLRPTWTPHQLPEHYHQLIQYVDTKVAPGLGEFAMSLCVHEDLPVHFVNMGNTGRLFRFCKRLQPRFRHLNLQRHFNFDWHGDDDWTVYVSACKETQSQLSKAQRILLDSHLFPIWHISEVKATSLQEWTASQNAEAPPRKGLKMEFTGQKQEQQPTGNINVNELLGHWPPDSENLF